MPIPVTVFDGVISLGASLVVMLAVIKLAYALLFLPHFCFHMHFVVFTATLLMLQIAHDYFWWLSKLMVLKRLSFSLWKWKKEYCSSFVQKLFRGKLAALKITAWATASTRMRQRPSAEPFGANGHLPLCTQQQQSAGAAEHRGLTKQCLKKIAYILYCYPAMTLSYLTD